MQLVTQIKKTARLFDYGVKSSCTRCSLNAARASQPFLAWVISPKYLPSEPAEECTHVMSCADITGE